MVKTVYRLNPEVNTMTFNNNLKTAIVKPSVKNKQ